MLTESKYIVRLEPSGEISTDMQKFLYCSPYADNDMMKSRRILTIETEIGIGDITIRLFEGDQETLDAHLCEAEGPLASIFKALHAAERQGKPNAVYVHDSLRDQSGVVDDYTKLGIESWPATEAVQIDAEVLKTALSTSEVVKTAPGVSWHLPARYAWIFLGTLIVLVVLFIFLCVRKNATREELPDEFPVR